MKRIVVEIDDDLHAKIKVICAKKRITIRQVALVLFKNWVERNHVESKKE